jgi:tetratricopeptide (TPR) repeat protein
VQWRDFDFGYAIRPLGDFGLTHRFSLAYHIPPAPGFEMLEDRAQKQLQKGQALEAKGEWLDALVEYRVALSLLPGWEPALQAAQRVEAQITATTAQPIAPAPAEAPKPVRPGIERALQTHLQNGLNYFKQNAYKKAIAEWKLVLEFSPAQPEAATYLRQAQEKLESERQKIYQLAKEARAKNDPSLEIIYWRKALELDPDDKIAQEHLTFELLYAPAPVDKEEVEKLKNRLKY